MGRQPPLPRLHVIANTQPGRDVLAIVDAALRGGAPCIQLRDKYGTDRECYELALAVAVRCHEAGATCIVNDRVDVALAVEAHGVHLGADDLPVDVARELVGDEMLVGATARDPLTARRLATAGADYLGVGPTFATRTKDGLPPPLGPDGVGAIARVAPVPVVAISGLSAANVPAVLAGGAYGVAVVRAIADAPDPEEATRQLLDALHAATAEVQP